MTEDLELLRFLQSTNAEIHDRAGGGSENGEAVDFKENVFVDYVLDHLADLGIVENA